MIDDLDDLDDLDDRRHLTPAEGSPPRNLSRGNNLTARDALSRGGILTNQNITHKRPLFSKSLGPQCQILIELEQPTWRKISIYWRRRKMVGDLDTVLPAAEASSLRSLSKVRYSSRIYYL